MAEQHRIAELLRAKEGTPSISLEFFPPRTEAGDNALIAKLDILKSLNPVFIDFTRGAGGTTSDKTPALCMASIAKGYVVNMHLTCTNMPEGKVREALDFCKANNIRNIVALRGDPPAGEEWKASAEGFSCALDLVKFIRENYGDFFCIAVAGYPEGHPNKIGENGLCTPEDYASEIAYLKQKVDAGADLIITQLFYEVKFFLDFKVHCKEAGITVPIVPGILPFMHYAGFGRIVSLSKTFVPEALKAKTEELKEDKDGFRDLGIQVCTDIVKALQAEGHTHFHYYCLNEDYSVMQLAKNTGYIAA